VKIMLFREHAANETFPAAPEPVEEPSWTAAPSRTDAEPPGRTQASMTLGDAVVFARLDLAEVLGIWRHARGRVVDVHHDGAAATVDVKFDGHDILERYLPGLFRRAH
jgi:hypothetical protein